MFLLLSCTVEGGGRVSRTRNRKIPLKEGVCISGVAAVVYVCMYTAGHRRECVTEMVRVKSADSPLSAMAGVKAPSQGTGVCEITF